MIDKIIEFCLKNKFLIIAGTLLVIGAGIWAFRNTPVDAIPDIGENQIVVFADWPGRSPKDVEDQVIYPLTTGLMGTPKVKVTIEGLFCSSIAATIALESSPPLRDTP